MTEETGDSLKKTPLYNLHLDLGAKMVPFAGYSMPIQYPSGILQEHNQTRKQAGLFDVSHMGQAWLIGENVAADLEIILPADITGMAPGQQRYSQILNETGGILDDLMITRPAAAEFQDRLFLVVNAACKEADFAYIAYKLGDRIAIERLEDRALLAVQGPASPAAVARLFGQTVLTQPFMSQQMLICDGVDCLVSRSGYTGEDGYEISIPGADADKIARAFLADETVRAIGLGARDSLRLEGGLCLYGHDIDTGTSPVEAGLIWSIAKRRRAEGGFPGHAHLMAQLANKPSRKRVGIRPEGRAPARAGTEITDSKGNIIGKVTSGGFGPTVGGPVAMGYVATAFSAIDSKIFLMVRGKSMPAKVVKLPFVVAGFYRG